MASDSEHDIEKKVQPELAVTHVDPEPNCALLAASTSCSPTVTGMTKSGNALGLIGVVYGSSSIQHLELHHLEILRPLPRYIQGQYLPVYHPRYYNPHLHRHATGCLHQLGTDHEGAVYDVGIGEILETAICPTGFAKFLLVWSGVGVNSNYCDLLRCVISSSLCGPSAKVPRVVWSLLVFAGILTLGIAGRYHLLA
ncbi:hypothetical protein PENDEC_c042G03902 [Penicillium decumbens]|uniref:Uncharacterized protein n=1 Tax=Penicillium decumbens TaxID=69771 RepID=A0A1V6NRD7_PENDC|nr:hypothetical protein PENDEC_c042G03902 [Penicillium decumbens]